MTKRRSSTTHSPPAGETFVRPYPPSWFDRFTDWVDRLPGPAWGAELALHCGFDSTEKIAAKPSSFLREIYSALSLR
jgi:hypothetical protein